eukprot:m51a1_g7099 hypothetical protein (96) ;mRNA; r:48440-48727
MLGGGRSESPSTSSEGGGYGVSLDALRTSALGLLGRKRPQSPEAAAEAGLRTRCRLISRRLHKYNVARRNAPLSGFLSSLFHTTLDMRWWKARPH